MGGLCHWTFCDTNKYPRWYRHDGPTGSSGTGPAGDHTSGSGKARNHLELTRPLSFVTLCCFHVLSDEFYQNLNSNNFSLLQK